MQEAVPPKYKDYQDDWGTTAREGYEDHGPVRPMRAAQHQPGSPVLRTLGAIAIVGGICWGTYLVTQGGNVVRVLEQNRGPVAIVGLGAVSSLLGKYLRV
jgi:hypothetical protein